MRKPRLLASLLCAVLMVGVLTVPAYAGGGDESEDGVGEYIPWEGLEPAEPNPFTPDGTGTVVDNATDQDGKEFFTITTAEEAVFYLVIDRQRETENVYFLNAVTVADLMALAESSGEPAAPEPMPEPDPEPDPTPEPEPVPEKKGGAYHFTSCPCFWLIHSTFYSLRGGYYGRKSGLCHPAVHFV